MKSEILLDIVTSLRNLATSLESAAATQLMDSEPEPSEPHAKEETPVKVIALEEVRSVLAETHQQNDSFVIGGRSGYKRTTLQLP